MRRGIKKIVITLLILLNITSYGVKANDDIEREVKKNAYILESVDPNSSYKDLMPLKSILNDKKIIGIGEATHNTKEFFQVKHKFMKFLIEELNYKAFAMEIDFSSASYINDYIINGNESGKNALLKTELWFWKTEEMLDFIDWLKTYNIDKPINEKVRFYGFDMQNYLSAIDVSYKYLEKVEDSKGLEINIDSKNTDKDSDISKIIDISRDIKEKINENKDIYISKTSEVEYDYIKHCLDNVDKFKEYENSNVYEYNKNELRDKFMAENVKWLVSYERKYFNNDKMMLWGHNRHITEKINYKAMGEILNEIYKEDYYSIGIDFYKGSFLAFNDFKKSDNPTKFNIKSSPKSHLSAKLEPLNEDIIYFDINKAMKSNKLGKIFSEKENLYVIDGSTSVLCKNSGVYNFDLRDSFDGIIYIEDTNAAKSLIFKDSNIKIETLSDIKVGLIILSVPICGALILFIIIKLNKKKKVKE